MLGVIAASIVAATGALWVYVKREGLGPAGVGLAALRTLAVALLVALVLNPPRTTTDAREAPVILLDTSLSLEATGGHLAAARDTARALAGARGTLLPFGDSRLQPALAAAAGLGGPVTVVTDGEIADAASIPSALRSIATTIVLERDSVPEAALTRVDLPERVAQGDTVEVRVEWWKGGLVEGDSADLAVWEGDRRLARVRIGPRRGALRVAGLAAGVHNLRIILSVEGDQEPRTNERYRLVEVSALPAVTLVGSPAGWEATFLARELRDIVRAPVGGYGEIAPGRWVDLATQQAVPVSRVDAAVRSAQLLVTVGSTPFSSMMFRLPVWQWPAGSTGNAPRLLPGEWYPATPPPSPLGSRLGGIAWDSLPPLPGVLPVPPAPDAWTGLAARLARRGAERPLVLGRDSAGVRSLITAGDGLWRWALRGGTAREAYRGLVAAGVDWLLGSQVVRDDAIVVERLVVPRGAPVVFRWTRGVAPDSVNMGITGGTENQERTEVLRFDAAGEARVMLEPGFWNWATTAPRLSGRVAVEPYSPEFVPGPVTIAAGPAMAAVGTRSAGLREWWWLYVVLIGFLLGEWGWRIRKGLP